MKKSLLLSAAMMLCGAFMMQAAVTVPEGVEVETYTGSATGSVRGEATWDVQVAVDEANNTMYVKNMLPGMEETGKSQWITGTIDVENGTVTFKTYQNAGYQKIKNTTYTYVEVFGYKNKKMVAATFNWDPEAKTLVSSDDEVQAYSEDYYMVVEKYTGFTLTASPSTGIDAIKVNNTSVSKIIENGQVVIVKDGVRYNIMGQKM